MEAGLSEFAALAERTRRAIVRLVRVYGRAGDLAERVRRLLAEAEPEFAAVVADSQLAAYVRAAREILKLPTVQLALPKPARPFLFAPRAFDAGRVGSVIFPQVRKAVESLAGKIAYTPEEFDRLDDAARRVGFTVARAQSLDAVRAVQTALARDVEEGGTLAQFRRTVAGSLRGSAIGPSQVEAIYRTHVGRAYSAGQVETLDNPAVRSAVPYLLYSATHDSRTRPEHLALERMGLNGTAVYRADDPIWDTFYPPWAWNCRCLVISIDVEEAARLGVREAKEWLKTGNPPAAPEFVKLPEFRPPPGWVPTGRRLTPLV